MIKVFEYGTLVKNVGERVEVNNESRELMCTELKELRKRFFRGFFILAAMLGVIGFGIYQVLVNPEGWLASTVSIIFLGDVTYVFYVLVLAGIGILISCVRVLVRVHTIIVGTAAEIAIFDNAVEHKVYAIAVSKLYQSIGDATSPEGIHYVSFDMQNGRRESFAVHAMQYNSILENERGLLTYKQNKNRFFFIAFQPSP